MTSENVVLNEWWVDFWRGWCDASSGRADEEHAYDSAAEHYRGNQDRPGDVVAAEVYARYPIDEPGSAFVHPDDVPF